MSIMYTADPYAVAAPPLPPAPKIATHLSFPPLWILIILGVDTACPNLE